MHSKRPNLNCFHPCIWKISLHMAFNCSVTMTTSMKSWPCWNIELGATWICVLDYWSLIFRKTIFSSLWGESHDDVTVPLGWQNYIPLHLFCAGIASLTETISGKLSKSVPSKTCSCAVTLCNRTAPQLKVLSFLGHMGYEIRSPESCRF